MSKVKSSSSSSSSSSDDEQVAKTTIQKKGLGKRKGEGQADAAPSKKQKVESKVLEATKKQASKNKKESSSSSSSSSDSESDVANNKKPATVTQTVSLKANKEDIKKNEGQKSPAPSVPQKKKKSEAKSQPTATKKQKTKKGEKKKEEPKKEEKKKEEMKKEKKSSSSSSSSESSESEKENEPKKKTETKSQPSSMTKGAETEEAKTEGKITESNTTQPKDEKEEEDESSSSSSSDDKRKNIQAEKILPKKPKAQQNTQQTPQKSAIQNENGNEVSGKRVYVANLSFKIQDEDIKEFFKDCGSIVTIDWVNHKDTGRFTGTGFLEFDSVDAAQKALAKNGQELLGRPIKVEIARPRAGKAELPKVSEKPEGCVTVFCGRLPYSIDEDTLREFFKDCGEIKQIRWVNDRQSGEFKGCGFVEFTTTEAVDKAIQLNGREIQGRAIRIDYAQNRS